MTGLDSLPYPLTKSELRDLEAHDDIEGVPAGVSDWDRGTGMRVRAFVVTTSRTQVAVVEDFDARAYRVLERGEQAYDAYREWCDEHGYGDDAGGTS